MINLDHGHSCPLDPLNGQECPRPAFRDLVDDGLLCFDPQRVRGIDGCNHFQVFWRIVLPLTKPALMAIFLFGVTNAWHEYLFAHMLIWKENLRTLPVGLGMMIIGDVQPWGELTGAALIMAVPVFILYAVGQRFMVAGLTAGAVKQ